MPEETMWKRDDMVAELNGRKFFQMCPPMEAYLYPGAKVLDVGCGPGPITRDIATIVHPGPVVGIDIVPKSIELAVKMVQESGISNLTFQVGDTHQLTFADGSYDIVLSLNVIGWLRDPVQALQEQRRVTREGGWVLVGMGDWANIIFYPPCPSIERFIAMLPHLNDPSEMATFIDTHVGRKAMQLMSQAGFKEIKIEPFGVAYQQGTKEFDRQYSAWGTIILDREGPVAPMHQKLIKLGVLDEQTILSAQRELAAWYAHPHALYMQMPFLAAGRVT